MAAGFIRHSWDKLQEIEYSGKGGGPADARSELLRRRLAELTPAQRALLARRLRGPREGEANAPRRRGVSRTQFGIWLFEELEPGTAAYNNPAALSLRGPLDSGALRAALELIQRRHDVLRSRYPSDDEGPYALVEPKSELPLTFVDLTTRPDAEVWVRTLAADAATAPFDLEAGPLWRLLLARLSRDEHLLVLVMHHLVSDGWSLGIFAAELQGAYAAAVAGEDPALPDLEGDYFSVVARRERELEAARPRLSAYWRERLAGFPAEVDLPREAAPAGAAVSGGTADLLIPAEVTASLERLCAREGTTRFAALVASLAVLLRLRSGQQRLLFTTPIANREDEPSLRLIGCFLNTVPLALELPGNPRLREVLRQARDVLAGALANGRLPFADVVAAAAGERGNPTRPLGNVMLLENNAPLEGLDLAGLRVRREPLPVTAVKHDLALTLARTAAGIGGQVEYSTGCFSAAAARRLGADFVEVAAALASRPEARVEDLAGAAGSAPG